MGPLSSRALRLSEPAVVTLLWVFAFAVRVAFVLLTGSYERAELGEANYIAISLAQSGRFANPYGVESGPTAHTAPLFPFLLSLVIRATGDVTPELFKQVVASAFSAMTYALLPYAARRLDLSVAGAVLVATAFAFFPLLLWTETQTWWDHLIAAPLLMLVCVHLYDLLSLRTSHHRRALVTGVLAGVLVFVYPPSLVAVLTLVVLYCARSPLTWKRRTTHLAIIISSIGLILAPWIINRSKALGGFVFLRTGYGITLGMAFNPDAGRVSSIEDPAFDEIIHRRYHPNFSKIERQTVVAVGELNYNRARAEAAEAWIRAHPWEAGALIARRLAYFWFPPDRRPWRQAVQVALTLGAISGLFVMWRERHRALLVLLLTLASFAGPYYLVPISARYRYPIFWILLLLGAHGITRALLRWRDRAHMLPERPCD